MIAIPLCGMAQKKLEQVSQTNYLSLPLPAGSKKDSRGISITAARALLATEAKNVGVTVNSTEVYSLPVESFTADQLRQVISAAGYTYTLVPSDMRMAQVVGHGKNYLVYFSKESYGTELYIGECAAVTPAQPASIPQAPIPDMPPMPSGLPTQNTGQNGALLAPLPAQQGLQTSGFQFNTSNFDDGWVSAIQADWVLVEKANARVYLYFVLPYQSEQFSGTGLEGRDFYWDNFVAKQFSITQKQYNDAGEFVSSLKPKYVEGRGVDPQTGQERFIAMTLAIAPNAAMVTVASFPDEQLFRQHFPKANDKFTSDLSAMARYNKFAIGPSDLQGTWQSGGSQMTQWYDAVTGAYAEATMVASSAVFEFTGNGKYKSIHNGATGAIGTMNTFQQEYNGDYSVSNWNITATNRYEGRVDNFDAHLQAVKGGRLLYLDDRRGGKYTLVRTR
jgi:hypothetical protein